jgi:hypothetical protein
MNSGTTPREVDDLRRRVTVGESYYDPESGGHIRRASSEDFQLVSVKFIEDLKTVPGFDKGSLVYGWLDAAIGYYNMADYENANAQIALALERLPSLEEHVFYVVRTCQRVMTTPLTLSERACEESLIKYRNASKLTKWTLAKPEFLLRCKWCGRYTRPVGADVGTFGINKSANSCDVCGRDYHMPSWSWDSPHGRAYSYYRMSFVDDRFYEEFEHDYDPQPRCKKRG